MEQYNVRIAVELLSSVTPLYSVHFIINTDADCQLPFLYYYYYVSYTSKCSAVLGNV